MTPTPEETTLALRLLHAERAVVAARREMQAHVPGAARKLTEARHALDAVRAEAGVTRG